RTFNLDIARARRIMEFFLDRLGDRKPEAPNADPPFVVHFEMVPLRFPPELLETVARFPTGSLRLEIGIQSLNPEVSARIGRRSDPAAELALLRFLCANTRAIVHADLIAGLPGEDTASFGRGLDMIWEAIAAAPGRAGTVEVQLGILKLLPGARIARHSDEFGMRYADSPPYEVLQTAAVPAPEMDRIKNFARFWELVVNRHMLDLGSGPVFERFMEFSDRLLARFGRNWGIPKEQLRETLSLWTETGPTDAAPEVMKVPNCR
ncbi:MAG: DUF4080 domain-containing protein, partial [Treponema sp.]|nr:DUF4080 domain-containing protein [Treponema sp.]